MAELFFQKVSMFPEFASLSNCSKCSLVGFENQKLLFAVSSGMLEALVLAVA